MTVSSKYSGPEFPNPAPITHKADRNRLTFNFSFLTDDSKYNLKKNSKYVNAKARLKLLEKIVSLSEVDKVIILNRSKEQGLELLPEKEVNLKVNQKFKETGRYDECDDNYWVFRLSKLGRVIGKVNGNIFYILAIDTQFKLYKH